jgi:hypothetical protein
VDSDCAGLGLAKETAALLEIQQCTGGTPNDVCNVAENEKHNFVAKLGMYMRLGVSTGGMSHRC